MPERKSDLSETLHLVPCGEACIATGVLRVLTRQGGHGQGGIPNTERPLGSSQSPDPLDMACQTCAALTGPFP